MADEIFNDNDHGLQLHSREPDAYGQAAMLLSESILHGLIAGSVISVRDATEIVAVAAEVKAEVADQLGDSPGTLKKSLSLLRAITSSLAQDLK